MRASGTSGASIGQRDCECRVGAEGTGGWRRPGEAGQREEEEELSAGPPAAQKPLLLERHTQAAAAAAGGRRGEDGRE